MLTVPGFEYPEEIRKTSRFAVHSYADRLHEPVTFDGPNDINPSRASSTFPGTLYFILLHSEENGTSHIISWQPHGRSFIIHDQKKMVNQVLPKYFNQTKYSSFQRQLNVYGFTKLDNGLDRGGYYHEYFLRGRPDLLTKIRRQGVKGTGKRLIAVRETEPNFYSMPHCSSPVTNNSEPRQNNAPDGNTTSLATPVISSKTMNVPLSSLFDLIPVGLEQATGRREENPSLSQNYNEIPEPRQFAVEGKAADYGVPNGRGYFYVDPFMGGVLHDQDLWGTQPDKPDFPLY